MEENQISIPFDLKYIHENVIKKIIYKLKLLTLRTMARFIDIILGIVLGIFLIPFSILVKIAYMLQGDYKPIFTIEKCFGKRGKTINVIKYRSVNKDGTVNRLRDTGWDNLPMVFNVLLGNMSIVGPKPYNISEKKNMGTYFNRIVQLKPGMTGLAQIAFEGNYTYDMRLDNDARYYYRKNWLLDLKIILITVLITIPRRNKGQIGSYLKIARRELVDNLISVCNRTIKRTIDICGALVGIVMLVPITIVVAIANILAEDCGPIFYVQERIGRKGKCFKMYKFRTMVVGADEKLEKLLSTDEAARKEYKKYKKLKNDPRITKIGKFLRETSLDEFPQFINILKGEMSLVGPRPYLVREKEDMKKYYSTIIKHKPGLTGLWQVSGRSNVSFRERLNLDMKYHDEANVAEDVKIICKTAVKVLKREDAA